MFAGSQWKENMAKFDLPCEMVDVQWGGGTKRRIQETQKVGAIPRNR